MTAKVIPLRKQLGDPVAFSDEALVGACATGDSAAMSALIDRFQQPLYRFVARLLSSDGDDRDDVVQATFIEVAKCAAKFRGVSSARTWIFGIAANIARNQIRSVTRRRRAESGLAALPTISVGQPDFLMERSQLMLRLGKALAELPHPLREAFVLCDVEDMPCKDAAVALHTSEGTIWRRVHEARRALREALQ